MSANTAIERTESTSGKCDKIQQFPILEAVQANELLESSEFVGNGILMAPSTIASPFPLRYNPHDIKTHPELKTTAYCAGHGRLPGLAVTPK